MELATCKNCKRLFNYFSGPQICPACKDNIEKKFIQVRDYVRANPNASMAVVAEENEVSIQQIKTWIRQERLCFSPESDVTIQCEHCGAKIYTGRYCDKCKRNMADTMSALYHGEEPQRKRSKENDKMRHFQH